MPGYGMVLNLATTRLQDAQVDSPALDARLLLEAVSGYDRAGLLLHKDDEMPHEQLAVYSSLLDRRVAREPVARILGVREFWGLPFRLSAGTLEPRPDSETLIEAVLYQVANRKAPLRLLDLGTGTGCLLAALLHELPHATGMAIDSNPQAVTTARENIAALGMDERAMVREGHWGAGVDERFHIVISNPPYIGTHEQLQPEVKQHDPALALFAGEDGLEAYRTLAQELPRLLLPDGLAVLELGQGQGDAVTQLMNAAGLEVLEIRPDLNEIPRAMVLTLQQK